MKHDSSVYLGVTKLEMVKLRINKLYYNLLVPKLKGIEISYTDTDSFLLRFIDSERKSDQFYLSNLDLPDKNNNFKYLLISNTSLVVQLKKTLKE